MPKPTLELLKSVCRKGGTNSSQDPFWISRYLYRPWTIYWTWAAAKLGLSANGVTLISGVAIFAGAILYFLPHPPILWLVGALCVQLYFILDHVDGELGRYERDCLHKPTGMSGSFYDAACHPGETALLVAIAVRLYVDLGTPWWLLVLTVIMLFPGHIAPWQQYCETLIGYARNKVEDGHATLPGEFLHVRSLAVTQGQLNDQRPSFAQRTLSVALQTVGFPGYWLTLLACTILDVIPGVPVLHLGEFELPYLLLWLSVRALHNTAASLKSTLVYGRRLRALQ